MGAHAYVDTVHDEHGTFQDVAKSLTGARSAFLPSWDAFDINNVFTWAFPILVCLSSLTQALWTIYPTHNKSRHEPDMTRLLDLTASLDWDLDMVAAILRLLLSDAGPYSITCPGPALTPLPTPPPALCRFTAPCPSPAATHAPSDHASTATD